MRQKLMRRSSSSARTKKICRERGNGVGRSGTVYPQKCPLHNWDLMGEKQGADQVTREPAQQ